MTKEPFPESAGVMRDIAIMARQKKSFAHIRAVTGWSVERLRDACLRHGIVIADAPAPPEGPQARPAAMPAKPGPRHYFHYYRDAAPDGARGAQMQFQTRPPLRRAIVLIAEHRAISVSHLLHLMVEAAVERDLWGALLDGGDLSSPSAVASASTETETEKTK